LGKAGDGNGDSVHPLDTVLCAGRDPSSPGIATGPSAVGRGVALSLGDPDAHASES